MPVTVDLEKCIGSRDCLNACAFNAIDVIDGKAVIYENCVDCDACVRACPTHAIISATPAEAAGGAILVVDFAERSGINPIVDRTARRANANAAGVRVDPTDAGAASTAIIQEAQTNETGLIVLPHDGAGSAVAARVAAGLNAALLSGCSDFTVDDAGGVRATRLRYGGIVKTSSRTGPGKTVVTLVPRGPAQFAGRPLDAGAPAERIGDAPSPPVELARIVVALSPDLPPEALEAGRAIARALGAETIDATALPGNALSPELYVAIGVAGSTEHNAAISGAGTVVALVADANAPIAQAADYLLVGDVSAQAKALLSAL
ncbi:MAG TPA: 4Fe-4S binding protein [Candidatus Eremiobacteraceae bacterium]|nr:4Fe-4S binding protein [Candidatus Eremiobacteraceae bacterium]